MKEHKILIVDDDLVLLDLMSRRLERMGYQPDRAQNGEDAIRYVENNHYDLVVTDLYMPKASGVDLIGAVEKKDPQTQVIAITGGAMIDMALDAIEKGAFAYLSKPFDHLKVFDHAVKKALEYRSMLLAGFRPGSDTPMGSREGRESDVQDEVTVELNQIIEAIPQALTILDSNGELVTANSTARSLMDLGWNLMNIEPEVFRSALNGGPGASIEIHGSQYILRAVELPKRDGDFHVLFHLQSLMPTQSNGFSRAGKYIDVLKTCLAWFYKQRLHQKEFQVLRAMAVQVSKLEQIYEGRYEVSQNVSGLTAQLPAMQDLGRVLSDGPQ
jgi:CheY-like chemotaxis protein